ncbi:MAG: AAA family ATPase [Candidatus Obscuribacter sp.]|nr:AAA family ATPase [Candidatus Obscuribacter sp.]MBK9277751.1 AAA family ATPase [Candidatus Obscuribacter sp.]
MKKIIAYLKSLSKNRLFRKSILHFGAFFAVLSLFLFLSSAGFVTRNMPNVLPPEYAAVASSAEKISAVELEVLLNSRDQSVKGLLLFPETNSIIVHGDGFGLERFVRTADLTLMRQLAGAVSLPVDEKKTVPFDPADYSRPFSWYLTMFWFAFWLGVLLFKRRERGEEKSRMRVLSEFVEKTVDALIKLTGLRQRNFYLLLVLSIFALNGLTLLTGVDRNPDRLILPPEMQAVERAQVWQVERLLALNKEDLKRVAYVSELNSAYMVIKSARPPTRESSGKNGGEVPEVKAETEKKGDSVGKPYVLERLVVFSQDAAGNAAFKTFLARLKEGGIEMASRSPVEVTGFATGLSEAGKFQLVSGFILCAFMVVGLALMWSEWDVEEGVDGKRSLAGAGGRGSHAGSGVEVREEDRKTFADVAGCQEAIDELKIVERKIRRPKLYKIFGAPVPSGVILHGPPGTGKTLLARALSGEIGGHFEAMSGSQFVEMYVGVGAKRVREAYAKARSAARRNGRISIIFIDEIDAIAKKRGSGEGGGDKEYEQTLNELLVQMNGFGNHGLVLTMAATNRLDILDEAILRPGRFDIKVKVPKPDKKGRAEIYAVYLNKLRVIGPDGDEKAAYQAKLLDDLARRSHDFSGAEIEGAIKNAATIAVERQFGGLTEDISDAEVEKYRDLAIIAAKDLHEGVDKMAYGTQIRSRVRTDKERWATAVHEIGHAAVPEAEGGDPVNRISIVMTDKSLGLMDSSPEEGERYDWTDEQFRIRLRSLLAGRAAEKLILGKISTGASNDFERASTLARQMVGIYGMSAEFGVKSLPLDQHGFPVSKVGEVLLDRFNQAWSKLVDEMEAATDQLIEKHRRQILACAEVLFEEETLTGDEFRRIWAANA